MTDEKTKPMTTAEKQRALRQRRADEGLTELRGVYAPTDLHAELKQKIAKWLKQKK